MAVFLFAIANACRALGPNYISDEDLAKSSVIVVAKWEKAPWKDHVKYGGQGIVASEGFTTLHVLRVIKGDIKPGKHPLLVGWGIAWNKDGTGLETGTSTEVLGDVKDITKSNLWFLKKAKSWDEKDATDYLSVDNYRMVQPPELEPYFTALAANDPVTAMRPLLASENENVVKHALLYAAGGVSPWPFNEYWDLEAFSGKKQGALQTGLADAVAAVSARKKMIVQRPLAVAVYAALQGENSAPYLRKMLADSDVSTRVVAAGLLARLKDAGDIEGINRALRSDGDGEPECRIIAAISDWGDARLVPALAAFLEDDTFWFEEGDEFVIPAFKARETLHKITGHWFPYDTQASLRAWEQVARAGDDAKRKELLDTLVPDDAVPLKAEVTITSGTDVTCTITNQSRKDLPIAANPDGYSLAWSHLDGAPVSSESGPAGKFPQGKKDFIILKPGGFILVRFKLGTDLLHAPPGNPSMKLVYEHTGGKWGMKAWIGKVDATIVMAKAE